MDNYWEIRYKSGGNSGSGSYNKIAEHKAEVINNYIVKYEIKTISDFGCGDGNQINMFKGFNIYTGFDISSFIIAKCINIFRDRNNMFFVNSIIDLPTSDLCLSLDVIYHILDNDEYHNYMTNLFNKSNRFVLIFSTDHDDNNHDAKHILHHKFSDWVVEYYNEFKLIEVIDNNLITGAKFYLYERNKNE